MRPVLVGELNPYGGDPDYALYPAPDGCAGHRLATLILGMTRSEYLERFERINLCSGEWYDQVARANAARIRAPTLILLGRKVARAFEFDREPMYVIAEYAGRRVLSIPHPSGRCRDYNDPLTVAMARRAVLKIVEAHYGEVQEAGGRDGGGPAVVS